MDKIRNAFTTAELLIVVIVIGFLAILVISSISGATPDRNKMLFKKAYSVTEKTVQELVNDETLYPYNPNKIGFLNDIAVQIPGEADGHNTGGNKKFAVLFSHKLDTIGAGQNGSNVQVPDEGEAVFTTTDGILWTIPIQAFSKGSTIADGVTITVDINGDKEPNKFASCDSNFPTDVCDENDPTADKFRIHVYFDGKVNVTGRYEMEYLTSHDLKRKQ